MKRFVSLLLAMLMLLSTAAFADALVWDFTATDDNDDELFYVSEDFVRVTGGDCHVRALPNLSGESLGVLREGQEANCLGGKSVDSRGVVWYEIDYKGMSGWVSSRYAWLNGVQSFGYVKVAGGDCNMRDDSNLNGDILAVLKEGAVAAYLGNTATDDRGVDWYFVSYNGLEGWVSSKYADFADDVSASYYTYVKATSYKVNLRDEPSLSGKDLGTMNEGETASYLGEKSTDSRGVVWYKVRFEGKTGWVSSRYSKLYN